MWHVPHQGAHDLEQHWAFSPGLITVPPKGSSCIPHSRGWPASQQNLSVLHFAASPFHLSLAEHRLHSGQVWAQWAKCLGSNSGSVTLPKSLKHSGPQFPHMERGAVIGLPRSQHRAWCSLSKLNHRSLAYSEFSKYSCFVPFVLGHEPPTIASSRAGICELL